MSGLLTKKKNVLFLFLERDVLEFQNNVRNWDTFFRTRVLFSRSFVRSFVHRVEFCIFCCSSQPLYTVGEVKPPPMRRWGNYRCTPSRTNSHPGRAGRNGNKPCGRLRSTLYLQYNDSRISCVHANTKYQAWLSLVALALTRRSALYATYRDALLFWRTAVR